MYVSKERFVVLPAETIAQIRTSLHTILTLIPIWDRAAAQELSDNIALLLTSSYICEAKPTC
jgi:hypothetical protein